MRTFSFLILILSQFATINTSFASLGDLESQVGSDQQKLQAQHDLRSSRTLYSVHELVSNMHTVKEYVGSDGVVFAISWQGVLRPDLKTLLGTYFAHYQALDQARPRMQTRAPVSINTDKIVVLKGGHMRDIRGLAYIPTKLPAGINLEDLQ